MDNPNPQKEYHEGPEAARRFEQYVRKVISVPREEYERIDKQWKKDRQKKAKRAKA